MAGEWRFSTWGDEISLEYGKALRDYAGKYGKYRVFGSNGPVGWTSQPLAPGPGVILGRKGAYRGVQYSPEPFFVIDTAYYLVPKTDLDMRWLFYAVKHYKLGEIDDGSPIPSTTRSAVYIVDMEVPSLAEQRAIVHILGTLDDKIELNRQMNETLEGIARAIFKSWFIDFDPVRAKAEGQDTGLPKHVADLFPDSFVDSELGEIPKRWEVWRVSDVGEIICGKTPSTRVAENFGNEVPFITIPDLHGCIFTTTTQRKLSASGANSQKKKMLPPGAICVSCIATVGLVVITTEWSQTNQQINSVIPKSGHGTYFWFWVFRDLGNEIRASGSGGSVLINLSTGRFSELNVLAPPRRLRQYYNSVVASLFEKILVNDRAIGVLSDLRDTLLPKLISGDLRVRDAERFVGKQI